MLPRLRRLARRHRRPLAAALAGCATLLIVAALRPAPAVVPASAVADPSRLRAGEASVPVLLSSTAVASALQVGDVVDLVAVSDTGEAFVVASAARVVELPRGTTGLGAASSAVALVAVRESSALAVTAAAAQSGLTFIRRPAA